MAKLGLKRREVIEDSLATSAEIKPMILRGDGIRFLPRRADVPQTGAMDLVNALGSFANKQLQETANAQHERAKLDGATQQVQGIAIDQLETHGDKWSREGWRLMNAKTAGAALVGATRNWIKNTGFQFNEAQFRENYGQRMEDMIQGMDPASQTAVRDNFTKSIPALVELHTTAHADYIEKQTFDSLVTSIDVISRDPTGDEALINFTMVDENSASAYLSDARKKAAVARGIQVAFRNDNPAAYGILRRAGVLDQLTLEQRNNVENARTQFTTRVLATANDKFIQRIAGIDEAIADGNLLYAPATLLYTEAYAEHGIEIDGATRGDIYRRTHEAQNLKGITRMVLFDRAIEAKDYREAARISAWAIEGAETRHKNVDGPLITVGANKGTRARGFMQITDLTAARPGYGVRPAQNNTPEELRRTGQDYWEAMFLGSALGIGNLPWPPGDIETAAVAYNAGPKEAIKFFNAGKVYGVLSQPSNVRTYVKRVLKYMGDMRNPTLEHKFNAAVKLLEGAEERSRWQSMEKYQRAIGPVLKAYRKTGDRSVFDRDAEAVRIAAGQEMTFGIVTEQAARLSRIDSQIDASRSAEQAAVDKAKFKAATGPGEIAWTAAMVDENGTDETRDAASAIFLGITQDAMADLNLEERATLSSQTIDKLVSKFVSMQATFAEQANKRAKEDEAFLTKNLVDLSPASRQKVVERAGAEVNKQLLEDYNTSKGTQEERKAAMSASGIQAYAQVFVDFNETDADQVKILTNAIDRGLLDENKKIRPEALDAIKKYEAVKKLDKTGNVRDKFLGSKAQATAESVLEMKGPFGNYEEAMQFVALNLNPQSKGQVDAFMEARNMHAAVEKAINNHLDEIDVGPLQAFFTSSATFGDIKSYTNWEMDNLRGEEEMGKKRDAVTFEVRRLFKLHPENDPAWMLQMAMQNVKRRSASIGGNFVMTSYDIMEAIFGENAQMYAADGIIQRAVVEWLGSDAMQREHKGLGDISWTEWLPSIVQHGLRSTGGEIADVFMGEGAWDWTKGLSPWEAKTVIQRKVRPMRSYNTPDRSTVFVEILNVDGIVGMNIQLDWPAIGAYFMKTHVPFEARTSRRVNDMQGFTDQP